MCKCIYKNIADNLDKDLLEKYYKTHTVKDTCDYFHFDPVYFYRIFDYLGIKRRTPAENIEVRFTYYDQSERNKNVGKGHVGISCSEETKEKISNALKNRTVPESQRFKISNTLKDKYKNGLVVWNKNKVGLQKWSQEQYAKYNETCRNRLPNTSKSEENFYNFLKTIFSEEDIYRQYSEERYPFKCDFYIKSKDLFIECNYFWHHGPHKFDIDNDEDLKLLSIWKEKSENSDQYKEAIKTWTERDIKKYEHAKINNLNYIVMYEK